MEREVARIDRARDFGLNCSAKIFVKNRKVIFALE